MELMEDEYEQRIIELQSDIDTLKSKLLETDSSSRMKDSERSTLGKKPILRRHCVSLIVLRQGTMQYHVPISIVYCSTKLGTYIKKVTYLGENRLN